MALFPLFMLFSLLAELFVLYGKEVRRNALLSTVTSTRNGAHPVSAPCGRLCLCLCEAESTGHPPASLWSTQGYPPSWCSLPARGQLPWTCLQIPKNEIVFSILTLLSSALFCNKSDLRHVDWVKSYLNIWSQLQAYIKEHHTTGLTWSKTVSTRPSGGLSPEHQKAVVKTRIPCGLIIISFRNYLRLS